MYSFEFFGFRSLRLHSRTWLLYDTYWSFDSRSWKFVIIVQFWEFCTPDLYTALLTGIGITAFVSLQPKRPGNALVVPCAEQDTDTNTLHWTLLGAFFPEGRAVVFFFDPTGNAPTSNHITALVRLREHLRVACRVPEDQLWSQRVAPTQLVKTRKQTGPHDSGVWIMAVARAWLAGDPCCVPDNMHMPGLRVLLAAETLISMRLPVTYYPTGILETERRNKLASLVALARLDEV